MALQPETRQNHLVVDRGLGSFPRYLSSKPQPVYSGQPLHNTGPAESMRGEECEQLATFAEPPVYQDPAAVAAAPAPLEGSAAKLEVHSGQLQTIEKLLLANPGNEQLLELKSDVCDAMDMATALCPKEGSMKLLRARPRKAKRRRAPVRSKG